MVTSSTKPYLTRAIWEWCVDNGLTPLLQIQVTGTQARIPVEFVKDGQIVLNISASATRNLVLGNQDVQFNARFGGVPREIYVPWNAVLGIYARETGEGMLFPPDEGEAQAVEPTLLQNNRSPAPQAPPKPGKQKKPTLTVIK